MAFRWTLQVVAVDNLWLCVAITLGMALVIGLAQPFAQPQMNVLQSACFACALAVLCGDWVLDPGKSVLTCEDSLGKGGCWSLVVKCRTLDMQRMQA